MANVRAVERADRAAYEVRWRAAGKFKQRTFAVRREAERFAVRIEDELARGATTDVYVRRGKTVADVVEACHAASAGKLKPRTVASYRTTYDLHVLPSLGPRRVAAVTSADVEVWVAGLTESGLAPATVRNTFVALNKVFRYAVRHRLVSVNPCTGTALPRATGAEAFSARFLTPAEVERVAAAADHDPPYGLIVRVAACTGLRAAELAGLRVRDVNLLRRELAVVRTVQRVKGGWVVGTPKSARSSRRVPLLDEAVVAALADYLALHPARHQPNAELWPGRAVGTHEVDWGRRFDHASFYRWYFKPALHAAGLTGVRFHDLRHTAASLWLAAGIDIIKVSRWLGHANISTTDAIYAHLYPSDHGEDAARYGAYIRRDAAPVYGVTRLSVET